MPCRVIWRSRLDVFNAAENTKRKLYCWACPALLNPPSLERPCLCHVHPPWVFNKEEREVLLCRTWTARSIASWIGEDLRRVMMTDRALDMSTEELQYRIDCKHGNDPSLVCEYEGSPFDVLPELVYSMTAYDDPADEAEARVVRDQSLWVTGVFWIVDTIVWVDKFGRTIREKRCDAHGLKKAAEAFERHQPFESIWWTEATEVGKYAEEEWWS